MEIGRQVFVWRFPDEKRAIRSQKTPQLPDVRSSRLGDVLKYSIGQNESECRVWAVYASGVIYVRKLHPSAIPSLDMNSIPFLTRKASGSTPQT